MHVSHVVQAVSERDFCAGFGPKLTR